jgi:integrase
VLSFIHGERNLQCNRMNQIPTDNQLSESGPESGPRRTARPSKDHLVYWEEAIFQLQPGRGNWWMKVQHAGTRRKLSLGTSNKVTAVAIARDIYRAVIANGWEATLTALRGPERPPRTETTVGQFLQELKAKADLKPETFKGYSIAFRAIIEDIFDLGGGKEKFDHKGGGHAKWIAKINAIRLADVTPARVQEWKRAFIAQAGDDPVRLRSAKTSVNSFLRRAKSLFSPKAIKHLSIILPSPLPFEGISFEPKQSGRYRSSIDPAELTRAAQKELAEDPPVFLAFLLALGAGLRRIEIDRLEWAAFRWNDNLIRIEPTRHFEPKTEHSIGDVQIDPELMAVFRGYAARSESRRFVIETGGSADLPLTGASSSFADHYRAKEVFERLSRWLRAQGVTARKPIHELRKEFGSMVNRKHGLSAAKDQLRHADIGITAQHYIDLPRQAASGLGAMLETGQKIIEFRDGADTPRLELKEQDQR